MTDHPMTEDRVQIIENAHPDDIRPGDRITRESVMVVGEVTYKWYREGIAHRRDRWGYWRTEDDMRITEAEVEGENVTITIRRTAPKLPTAACAVIVANDGNEHITATFQGVTYYAREAVLDMNGRWRGAWRGHGRVKYHMYPSQITPDTWKVDDHRTAENLNGETND